MENYKELIRKQRQFFSTGITQGLEFRLVALKKLWFAVIENEHRLISALKAE